ncbi:unnamed protein product [Candidula unifasciata]|uniref:Chitin-binding type-2 domain-containing protein n=1 Tax=Candidula unifasciata TaxID=100452 RepID=A0A8S4A0P1_9EUPU|nr:unnamed protein product [Candidula unifasciata]
MDGSRILFACIIGAVVTAVYSELDKKIVNINSEGDKYLSSKHYRGKHTETSRDISNKEYYSKTSSMGNNRENIRNAKYSEEKTEDYSDGKEEKQYNTDNNGKVKDKNWGTDYGSDYKGDSDVGEDSESGGKKEYRRDGINDVGSSKDSYTSLDTADVTCSYGVKFIAHPEECTKFYQCAHLKPFLFTCPSGLYFNTHLEVCDWPSNVDCSNDDAGGPSYKTSYKTSKKLKQGPSYQSADQPDYHHDGEYKTKPKSISHPREMTSHKSDPTEYEDTDEDSQDTVSQSNVDTDSHMFKDNSKYNKHYQSRSSQKSSSNYPLTSPYHHMMAPFLPVGAMHFPMVPVMQSPLYQPFVPLHAGPNQSPVFLFKKVDDQTIKQSGDQALKESTGSKESKIQEDSTYQTKKTESSDKTHTSRSSTISDDKTQVQTVKKVIIKKSRPVFKQDVSGKDKTDQASSKRFYYYYYEDDIKDNDKKTQGLGVKKDETKNVYYYYVDGGKSDSYKDKRPLHDYDNKYDYYYGNNNYDYNYEDNSGKGNSRVQHLVSVDNKYNNKNKKQLKTSANYKAANEISDEELGVIHFNHLGRDSKTKAKGEVLGDISSLLPLMLLGGASGGQQLLMTSLLLSGLKSGGNRKGEQTKGKGDKDDIIKQLVLLSLLNGNGNNNPLTGSGNNNIPTVNVPNVQMMNGQFVNIATGQPAVLLDPVTGQQVTPAQVSVNPTTGQLAVTATGNPVFLQDSLTGNLQPAIVGNTIQGNPLLPVTARRRPGRRVNFGANMNNINNRFIPLAPALANQHTATSASGHDAVNLIFLSPLTPSSLPPPINNDGSATLIRGSLRDILGPNLANFISNVPLVPGQGLPNSAAGSKQSCNVVRSGETVPFRISPRGGRLLPSECDAIGKLLDKFVPTFLQNFVPSDAAFAGFGSSNRNSNNSQQSVTSRPNIIEAPTASSNTVSSGTSNFIGGGSINDFINVRNDHNGCIIAVPNIVSQC